MTEFYEVTDMIESVQAGIDSAKHEAATMENPAFIAKLKEAIEFLESGQELLREAKAMLPEYDV